MIFDVFRYRVNCDFYNPRVYKSYKVSFPEHIPFCHRKHDLNFYELESNAEYVEFAHFDSMSEYSRLKLALEFNQVVRGKLSFYSNYYANTFVKAYNRDRFGKRFFFTVEKMNLVMCQ